MRAFTERPYEMICHQCRLLAVARPPLSRRIWSLAGTLPRPSAPNGFQRTVKRLSKPNISAHIGHQTKAATFNARRSEGTLQELQRRGTAIFGAADVPPSESDVEDLLKRCVILAAQIAETQKGVSEGSPKEQGNPAAALLGLDHTEQRPPTQPPVPEDSTTDVVDDLSKFAYQIVIHPHVFMSEAVLRLYVKLQSLLKRPESLPDVFTLYATKPIPVVNTRPLRYKKPNPNGAQYAIPPAVAAMALDDAIGIKDLELALAIIETSYALSAFRRSKLIRKGLIPGGALALTPVAAYAVAARVSADSLAGDGYLTTEVAFAGIVAYVGFTGMLGFVALTTANDQMERVTWVPGTPLWERWRREDERAAIDKVTVAWGYKNPLRRGEEEGEEWEALRHWIARRGMILDKESLMPGMN